MNKAKALKILSELASRESVDLLSECFAEQKNFIIDKSKRKSALCSRRAAKSYSAAIMLVDACLKNPNVSNAYIGLTKETAKNVLIPHIKKLKAKYKLKARIYSSPTKVYFPNGSQILFFGLNDSEEEREKILGQAFKVVVIDECASMTIDLKEAIRSHISPTLLDHDGQLVLCGTPSNLRNYFYEVTENKVPGWSNHRWTADKNPHVAKQYIDEINELKKSYPNIESDHGFQQHYLGKWTFDKSKQLYKISADNIITQIPPSNDYQYILSIDLGWKDSNAFTVGAFKPFDKTLYIVYSYKQPSMITDEINNKINEIEKNYPFYKIVIDSANKQFVQELSYRTGRYFHPAAKSEKLNYIHMLNSDLVCNKLKILDTCQSLIDEMNALTILDDTTNNYQVAVGNQQDHQSDSLLYLWRESLNHFANAQPPPKPLPQSQQAIDDFWSKEEQSITKSSNTPFWDR